MPGVSLARRAQSSPFPSSSRTARLSISPSVGLDGIQRKYDSPVSRAEENHGIVMKPAPIMETDEGAAAATAAAAERQNERKRRQAGRQARGGGRRERDQEQTKKKRKKKKDLLQTQKPFAHGRGEEASAGRTARDGHRAGKRRRRGGEGGGEKRAGRTRGGPVPSYHAASMGPLIFAALRFCLALSTLHTSTADRRHKTLYRDSARKGGREARRQGGRERRRERKRERETERERESRQNRPNPMVCAPLCPVYATLRVYVTRLRAARYVQRLAGYFFDGLVPPCVGGSAISPGSRVTGISDGNQTARVNVSGSFMAESHS